MIIDENVLQSNFMLFTHIPMITLITGSVSSRRHAAAPQLLQDPGTNRFIQTTPTLLKIDAFSKKALFSAVWLHAAVLSAQENFSS